MFEGQDYLKLYQPYKLISLERVACLAFSLAAVRELRLRVERKRVANKLVHVLSDYRHRVNVLGASR